MTRLTEGFNVVSAMRIRHRDNGLVERMPAQYGPDALGLKPELSPFAKTADVLFKPGL